MFIFYNHAHHTDDKTINASDWVNGDMRLISLPGFPYPDTRSATSAMTHLHSLDLILDHLSVGQADIDSHQGEMMHGRETCER